MGGLIGVLFAVTANSSKTQFETFLHVESSNCISNRLNRKDVLVTTTANQWVGHKSLGKPDRIKRWKTGRGVQH